MTRDKMRLILNAQEVLDIFLHDGNTTRPGIDQAMEMLDNGWTTLQAMHGYEVFAISAHEVCEVESNESIWVSVIQRIDDGEVFDSDLSAATQAEMDGVRLIDEDMLKPDVDKSYRYVDTIHNRQILCKD